MFWVRILCMNRSGRLGYCRPPPLRDNVPHGLLSPTLLRFVSSALSHKMFFFLAKLALQGNRANGEKSLPGAVPGPKKRTKTVPKSGSFQTEVFCSVAKKVPKIGPAPALAWTWSAETGSASGKHLRKMQNLRLKVRTQRRPAQFSCGDLPPKRRSNRNVLWRAFNLMVTKLYFQGPKMWTPSLRQSAQCWRAMAKALRTTVRNTTELQVTDTKPCFPPPKMRSLCRLWTYFKGTSMWFWRYNPFQPPKWEHLHFSRPGR